MSSLDYFEIKKSGNHYCVGCPQCIKSVGKTYAESAAHFICEYLNK